MEFYRDLYVTESIKPRKEKILLKLKQKKYPPGIFLLTVPSGGDGQLEFFSSALLRQELLKDENLFVVGIAAGYDDAVYLVEEITAEVYWQTGGGDLRAWLERVASDAGPGRGGSETAGGLGRDTW